MSNCLRVIHIGIIVSIFEELALCIMECRGQGLTKVPIQGMSLVGFCEDSPTEDLVSPFHTVWKQFLYLDRIEDGGGHLIPCVVNTPLESLFRLRGSSIIHVEWDHHRGCHGQVFFVIRVVTAIALIRMQYLCVRNAVVILTLLKL